VSQSLASVEVRAWAADQSEYVELKRVVRARGLFEKQPGYYARQMALLFALSALSVACLVLIRSPWIQALNALFLAFIFGQITFLGHDAGHGQILHTSRQNELLGLFLINLMVGASRAWWVDKHNRHHGSPNQVDVDPDIDFPVIAFAESQARRKVGLARFIVRYQGYFFFPLLLLEAFNLRYHSTQYILTRHAKYRPTELTLIAIHLTCYVGAIIWFLGPGLALLFILVHQAAVGVYLGSSFATNHKGRPVLEGETPGDFLRQQVETSRNLTYNPVTDFVFGPLVCQIEHHLFPTIPRNRLRQVQQVVRPFCLRQGLDYHETTPLVAYQEVLGYLTQIGRTLAPKSTARA
jgi:fatty acid desaturase